MIAWLTSPAAAVPEALAAIALALGVIRLRRAGHDMDRLTRD